MLMEFHTWITREFFILAKDMTSWKVVGEAEIMCYLLDVRLIIRCTLEHILCKFLKLWFSLIWQAMWSCVSSVSFGDKPVFNSPLISITLLRLESHLSLDFSLFISKLSRVRAAYRAAVWTKCLCMPALFKPSVNVSFPFFLKRCQPYSWLLSYIKMDTEE